MAKRPKAPRKVETLKNGEASRKNTPTAIQAVTLGFRDLLEPSGTGKFGSVLLAQFEGTPCAASTARLAREA